ncbi:glycosyltransferase family 4 protein [Rhodococcus sp. ANT_H53B]|uniref:glycosyltransferase family 4 protein n=1 Tax=Rhodococcus sp. ANT_H53B TaxID=2597357 RepID=UPI0021D3C3C0|nr:glycosyltransferase family 4 protein [Rhodococcus sp. ANT_H53B]
MPSKPIRVWFLDHSPDIGGGEMALLQIIPALSVEFDPLIVCPEGKFADAARMRGIAVNPLDLTYRNLGLGNKRISKLFGLATALKCLFELFIRLRREVAAGHPDLIYCNTLRMCLVGGVVGKVTKVPVVCHIRDSLAYPYMSRVASAAMRLVVRATATSVVANSGYTARQLRHVPSVVIGSPIDDEFFNSRAVTRSPIHEFIMVGRFAPWKGQLEAVQAFALAFPHGTERLAFVGGPLFGEAAYMREVRLEAVRCGVSDRVQFVGHSDDVPTLMRSARAVVHASTLPEPLGQVTLQAAALGKPLIVADAGGPDELFDDGVNAKKHRSADIESLAEAFRWIANNPADSAAMGEQARSVAVPFQLCVVTPLTEALILRAVGR